MRNVLHYVISTCVKIYISRNVYRLLFVISKTALKKFSGRTIFEKPYFIINIKYIFLFSDVPRKSTQTVQLSNQTTADSASTYFVESKVDITEHGVIKNEPISEDPLSSSVSDVLTEPEVIVKSEIDANVNDPLQLPCNPEQVAKTRKRKKRKPKTKIDVNQVKNIVSTITTVPFAEKKKRLDLNTADPSTVVDPSTNTKEISALIQVINSAISRKGIEGKCLGIIPRSNNKRLEPSANTRVYKNPKRKLTGNAQVKNNLIQLTLERDTVIDLVDDDEGKRDLDNGEKKMLNIGELKKQVSEKLKPSSDLQEQVSEKLKASTELQERVSEILKPSLELQERVSDKQKPLLELQEQVSEKIKPLSELKKQVTEKLKNLPDLSSNVSSIKEPQTSPASLDCNKDLILNSRSDSNTAQVSLNSSDTPKLQNQLITVKSLEELQDKTYKPIHKEVVSTAVDNSVAKEARKEIRLKTIKTKLQSGLNKNVVIANTNYETTSKVNMGTNRIASKPVLHSITGSSSGSGCKDLNSTETSNCSKATSELNIGTNQIVSKPASPSKTAPLIGSSYKDLNSIEASNSIDTSGFCRICLKFVDDSNSVGIFETGRLDSAANLRIMLVTIFPKIKLHIYPNPVVCNECILSIRKSFALHTNFLNTEENIESYIASFKRPEVTSAPIYNPRFVVNKIRETSDIFNKEVDDYFEKCLPNRYVKLEVARMFKYPVFKTEAIGLCHFCGEFVKISNHLRKSACLEGNESYLPKNFHCTVCSATFRTNFRRIQHFRLMHQQLKFRACSVCGNCIDINNYNRHMLLHE